MSLNPWEKGYRPRPLDPWQYSEDQRLATEGKLSEEKWEQYRLLELAHRFVARDFPKLVPGQAPLWQEDDPMWQRPDMLAAIEVVRASAGFDPNKTYGRCSVKGCTALHETGYRTPRGEDQQGSDSPTVTPKGPMWPGSCPPCDRRWRSETQAHCPTCHRHFGAVSGFDMHRRDGRCLDPAELTGYRAMHLVDRVGGPTWVRRYGASVD